MVQPYDRTTLRCTRYYFCRGLLTNYSHKCECEHNLSNWSSCNCIYLRILHALTTHTKLWQNIDIWYLNFQLLYTACTVMVGLLEQ